MCSQLWWIIDVHQGNCKKAGIPGAIGLATPLSMNRPVGQLARGRTVPGHITGATVAERIDIGLVSTCRRIANAIGQAIKDQMLAQFLYGGTGCAHHALDMARLTIGKSRSQNSDIELLTDLLEILATVWSGARFP